MERDNWITRFVPEPLYPGEFNGLKRMVMGLMPDRQGVVKDCYGKEYIVHPSGTVQRLTKKKRK